MVRTGNSLSYTQGQICLALLGTGIVWGYLETDM